MQGEIDLLLLYVVLDVLLRLVNVLGAELVLFLLLLHLLFLKGELVLVKLTTY